MDESLPPQRSYLSRMAPVELSPSDQRRHVWQIGSCDTDEQRHQEHGLLRGSFLGVVVAGIGLRRNVHVSRGTRVRNAYLRDQRRQGDY